MPTALGAAEARLEKQFGKGTIFRLGDKRALEVKVVPSGCLALDIATGVGGIPRGRITEIFGPESGGKTTLALSVVAQVQKAKGKAAYVDAEHALDPKWAATLGVDTRNLRVCQPDSGEQGLEVTEALIRSGDINIVVVDSVSALIPRSEIEGVMGDAQMGVQARMMSQAMRKLAGVTSKSEAVLIFINQLRYKIGVMYGNPETTSGGTALKFAASIRLDVRRSAFIKDGDKPVGARTRIKVVKNKVAAPFGVAETDLLFGKGFSRESDLVDLGLSHGIIQKSGSWFSHGAERLGQGKQQSVAQLEASPEWADRLEQEIRAGLKTVVTEVVDETEEAPE